jgi:hypothetical protein
MLFLSPALLLAAPQAADLAPPFRVEAGGAPISVAVGHAHARLHDLDGDSKRDLMVGQFGGGKCRIYRNVGSDAAPAFEDFEWLKAGDQPASVAAS